jgi:ADP-heptose:LPS heptosyltransferase
VSLQVGPRAQEPAPEGLDLIRFAQQLNDFSDTAALMSNLDLVITTDTAAAHLAGALGRRVWTLLASAADWRWGISGETTPWYPSMRLYRQPRLGDWASVVETVAKDLEQLVGSKIANQTSDLT